MSVAKDSGAEWIAEHRVRWNAKKGLREYYRHAIFARIERHMAEGPSLEVGAGPGFFGAIHPGVLLLDITFQAGIDVCADAQALPFADESFANIVGVDVLHHLARPAAMLREVRRVLGPGGRLILVEPWTGAMGRLFYAYVHHEDCRAVADPWHRAFASDKGVLEGNAMLPKILLKDRAGELDDVVGGLPVSRIEPFGSLSYLLTGGFQGWGFPFPVVEGLRRLEDTLPRGLLSVFGVRALFVLERS